MLKSIIQKKLIFQSSIILTALLCVILLFLLYYCNFLKKSTSRTSENHLISIHLNNQTSNSSPQSSIRTLQKKKLTSVKNTTVDQYKNKCNKNFDQSNLNNLLDTLINNKNILMLNDYYIQSNKDASLNKKENINRCDEISLYTKKLTQAITDKFYFDPSYFGKKCVLHITLSEKLKIIRSFEGNFALCQAAISAVKLSELPDPPNLKFLETVKNIILNFSL